MKHKLFLALTLCLALLLGFRSTSAQNPTVQDTKDYATHAYWREMMLEPNANFFEVQKAFYTYWEGRTPTRGTGYKPFKRWEYYWQSRLDADGTLRAPDQVYKEYTRYAAVHPVGDLKSGGPQWIELGPKTRVDIGGYTGVGRISAIAFHPTDTATIYVGAPSGGFWITHNSGLTWSSATDNMPTLGVSAILVDQSQPNNILIGTGDRDGGNAPGLGVFRSIDGGLSFSEYNNGMGNTTIGMFAQDPNNPAHILAAGDGGMFVTTNGGQTWAKTSTVNANYRDVKFRPLNSTVAYATADGYFYRTTDGGQTWNQMPPSVGYVTGGRLVIGTTPANDSLVYLLAGADEYQGTFLSRDFGQTFATQSTSPNILGWSYDADDEGSQAWYDLIIHVDPQIPSLVHIGGVNLWKSSDSGKTWACEGHWWGDRTNEVHADHHVFALNPRNNRIYNGNDGGVYWSQNQGGTWTEISEGLGIGQMYKLGVSPNYKDKVSCGFQDNGCATYLGTHWISSGGGDGMECVIDPFDSKWNYTACYYGGITRFTNDASSRQVAGENVNGITEKGAWVTPYLISEWDGNVMVAGYKNIWISRNIRNLGTITFTKISNNLAGSNSNDMSVLEHSPANRNLLFAVRSDSKMFRTDNLMDSTVAWINLTASLPVSGTPSDVECYPYDENIVYLALNNRIYKSLNKGGAWENISGTLPDININSIFCDKTSDDGVYISTDAGVYYRDASMEDWVLHGTGLPVNVEVSEVEIYYDRSLRTNSRLRASTYGRGMWEVALAPSNAALPPTLLTATDVDGAIELNWQNPFYQQTITGYKIYRNNELLNTINGSSYTDINIVPDVTYTYTITAIYTGNTESRRSNEATATIVSPIVLPYSQSFDNSTGGYLAKYTLEGWKYGTSDQLLVPGREGKFFAASSYAAGEGVSVKDYLTTPSIDLSSYTGKTVTLKFAYTMRKWINYDKFSIHYRTDPGSDWAKLADMRPPGAQTWVWDTTEINLPERALTSTMQIGFYYTNSNTYAYGAAIDDVQLFVNSTSAKPVDYLSKITVYPNPGNGLFHLNMALAKPGNVTIRVVNITGQVILEKNLDNASGTVSESIDLTSQPKGLYQLIVQSAAGEWIEKITLQ